MALLMGTTLDLSTVPLQNLSWWVLSPLADGFMGHGHTAFEQQFLHFAVAQSEAIGEPDPVADDCAGKAVVLGAHGVGRRSHAWLPILEFTDSLRGHRRGDYVTT